MLQIEIYWEGYCPCALSPVRAAWAFPQPCAQFIAHCIYSSSAQIVSNDRLQKHSDLLLSYY